MSPQFVVRKHFSVQEKRIAYLGLMMESFAEQKLMVHLKVSDTKSQREGIDRQSPLTAKANQSRIC